MHTSASHAETALDSPSPPLGGGEGRGEVGRSRFRAAAPPTSPSPSLTRWVPPSPPASGRRGQISWRLKSRQRCVNTLASLRGREGWGQSRGRATPRRGRVRGKQLGD